MDTLKYRRQVGKSAIGHGMSGGWTPPNIVGKSASRQLGTLVSGGMSGGWTPPNIDGKSASRQLGTLVSGGMSCASMDTPKYRGHLGNWAIEHFRIWWHVMWMNTPKYRRHLGNWEFWNVCM
eukprot:150391_1